MNLEPRVILRPPTVIYRHDGVPVDATQYDDHIVLHRPERHRPGSRGRESECTNRGCRAPAVIDKRVYMGRTATWRAVCAQHGRTLTKRLSPALAELVHQMVDASSGNDS